MNDDGIRARCEAEAETNNCAFTQHQRDLLWEFTYNNAKGEGLRGFIDVYQEALELCLKFSGR